MRSRSSSSDQLLGDLFGDQLHQGLGRLLLQGHLGLGDVPLAQPLGDVGGQRLHRGELGGLGGPLVGHLGEDELLHVLDQHLEGHRLAEPLQGGVEGQDVAGLGPAQLVVELGDHGPAPHLVEEVLGIEVGVVTVPTLGAGAVDVDGHLVTVLGRPGHLDQLSRGGSEPVDLGRDLLVGDLEAGQCDHEALVAGDAHGRADQHHGVEVRPDPTRRPR